MQFYNGPSTGIVLIFKLNNIIRNKIIFSKQANGFYGAKGLARGIPDAYSLIAKTFCKSLEKMNEIKRFSFLEYKRNDWAFHAKGLWLYSKISEEPYGTIIGSSNFNVKWVKK